MAQIDSYGLLSHDAGDVLRVDYKLRESDYGPLQTPEGLPLELIWHLTGNWIPEECESGTCDGAEGMAKRIASGQARYYGHGLLDRGGVFHQNVRFDRSAIAVSGSLNGVQINHLATHIEVVNFGYANKLGVIPGGAKIDPERDDARQHGSQYWQMLTVEQNCAIVEIALAWRDWAMVPVSDCLRGHVDVRPQDGHVDPGPELRAYLDTVVRSKLEQS